MSFNEQKSLELYEIFYNSYVEKFQVWFVTICEQCIWLVQWTGIHSFLLTVKWILCIC